MTTVSVEEFRSHPDEYLAATAKGDVVVTQDGKPWVVLRAVDDDQDRLSAAYVHSPEFWRMIQQRRQEQGIPWQEARRQLDLEKDFHSPSFFPALPSQTTWGKGT